MIFLDFFSRWPFRYEEQEMVSPLAVVDHMLPLNATDESILHVSIMRWITVNADHIVVLIILLALALKFILFEEKEQHFLRSDLDFDGKFFLEIASVITRKGREDGSS